MSLIVKDDSQQSKYPQLSTGVHNARCIRVIDLGTQRNEYQGQVSWKRKVMITWDVHNNDSEEPTNTARGWRPLLTTLGGSVAATSPRRDAGEWCPLELPLAYREIFVLSTISGPENSKIKGNKGK